MGISIYLYFTVTLHLCGNPLSCVLSTEFLMWKAKEEEEEEEEEEEKSSNMLNDS